MKLLALGTTFTLLLSSAAMAQERPQQPTATQLPQQLLPTGEEDAGARAESFEARSAQEARQSAEQRLREMIDDSPEGLETVRKPDGTVGMNLAGRFMHVMVATPTQDGRYVSSCHTGHEALSQVHRAQSMTAGKLAKLKAAQPVAIVERQPVLEEK